MLVTYGLFAAGILIAGLATAIIFNQQNKLHTQHQHLDESLESAMLHYPGKQTK